MSVGERLLEPRISRRRLLIGGAAGAGALAYASGMVYDKAIRPRFFFSVPEAEDVKTDRVNAGVVAIYKGINIRTSPNIPSRSRFKKPDNRLDWESIETVNGYPLNESVVFCVVNPYLVSGQDTYEDGDPDSFWIKLSVKAKKGKFVKPFYINYSANTREFVKHLGFAGFADGGENVAGNWAGQYVVSRDLFNANDVGRIIVPRNAETLARDIMPDIWSRRARQKIDGKKAAGERTFGKLKVVADDDDMQRSGMPVNLREYPALEYGDGEKVQVLARIPLGTRIDKALYPPDDFYHNSFAAVRSEDIKGYVLDFEDNLISPPTGKVYAISMAYLRGAK